MTTFARARILPGDNQVLLPDAGVRPAAKVANSAGTAPRLLAITLDLMFYALAAPVTLTTTAVLLRGLWPVGAVVILFGYFACSYSGGHSPGMRLLDLRMVDVRSGRRPSPWQAGMRAGLTVGPIVAGFLLLAMRLGEVPALSGDLPGVAAAVAIAGFLGISVAGQVWCVGDRCHRTLVDHFCGVAVVRRAAVRPAGAAS